MDKMRSYEHPDVFFVRIDENDVIMVSPLGDNDRDDFDMWRNQ